MEKEKKESEERENCIFCKIVNREIPSEKIYEDKNFIAILDINPEAEGHTLIISKSHYKTLLDVPQTLGSEILGIVKKIVFDLMKEKKAEGFNLIINNYECAQQEIPHFHLHIIPRKTGDGIKLKAVGGLRDKKANN